MGSAVESNKVEGGPNSSDGTRCYEVRVKEDEGRRILSPEKPC